MPFPCDHCNAVAINGVNCHEAGCPDSWRDYDRECKWCGSGFHPAEIWEKCCSRQCEHDYYAAAY